MSTEQEKSTNLAKTRFWAAIFIFGLLSLFGMSQGVKFDTHEIEKVLSIPISELRYGHIFLLLLFWAIIK